MRGVFNPDSPMMRALGVVWDLIVLNLLFLVCCIPVVTIGPAITALHYVTTKMAGEKDGTPVVGNFFSHSGKFPPGRTDGNSFGAAGGFLGYDIYLLWHSGNFQNSSFKILIPVAAIAYMMTFVYAFPLLARFNNTVFRYHTECVYHVCDLFAQNLFHVVVDRRMCSTYPVYTDHIALWIVFVVCAGVLFDRLCKCICFK